MENDSTEPPSVNDPAPEAATIGTDQSADAPDTAEPRGWVAAFRAMRHRNFRLFFGGQLTSLIGTWMQMVAQAWLVLKLSNSSMMLGIVTFAGYVPILLVALFAGVVIDYVDRRRLIVLTQALLMLSAFVLAALTWAGVVRVEHVIILAAFNGLVSAFDMPARQAFVVEMVGIDDLPNAIALNSMIFNGARTVGPAIAGLLIAMVGTAACFFLNGVSYIAVIWSLLAMELPAHTAGREFGAMVFQRLREGLAYVWYHRPSLCLLLLVAINSGFGMQYTVLMPIFARDILHDGARGYGFLMAAQGVGAVIGAITLASRSGGQALRQNLTLGLFGASVAIVVFGLSPFMSLSLVAQMLIGAGLINYMASTNTMLQLFVSDELRGRVMSLYTLSFIGMAPFGSLAVGFIGEHFSPEIAVVICGLISLATAALLLTRLPLLAEAQTGLTVRNATV
ncbi:MAG: MFS transporter [Candidatus Binataceae bacterium]